jgi:hypothetical protein
VLNRASNSLEERTRHTRDFYVNQEAQFIETKVTQIAKAFSDYPEDDQP